MDRMNRRPVPVDEAEIRLVLEGFWRREGDIDEQLLDEAFKAVKRERKVIEHALRRCPPEERDARLMETITQVLMGEGVIEYRLPSDAELWNSPIAI